VADAATQPSVDLDASFERLVEELHRATEDRRAAARLVLVGLTAVITVQGAEHLACTLRFAGEQPEVLDGAAQGADVTLRLSPRVVDEFWDVSLPMVIKDGEVDFDGPVRRLLAVLPVLRAHARGSRATRTSDGGATPI
jgi:ubiquinone biosynthesis protein UbiJ